MAPRRGASISQKMILTSTALVLAIVGLSGVLSALNTRRIFDEAAARLAEAHRSALEMRGRVQTQTMLETARTALMENYYTILKSVVAAAAKNDADVQAIYVATYDPRSDIRMVAAHSDSRLNERPINEVDPALGRRLAEVTEPESLVEPPEGADRQLIFARPVMASVSGAEKKLGTLVVRYSMKGLDTELLKIRQDKVNASRSQLLLTALLGLVFVFLGISGAVWQALRITRPITELSRRADQIAHGDLDARVDVVFRDEIGDLARNFNYMADRLQVLLSDTAARATLEKDLEIARTIQETMVPSADPIDRDGVRIAGYFQPATQCGGDWWTAHDLPDGRVLLVIGDVTGHGVPSAMITAAAKAACDVVRALEGSALTPGRLLSTMNRAIFESARRKFVMTCFVTLLDPKARTITYSNAGHNFPYLYRAPQSLRAGESEFTVLMSRGNRLGDLSESSYAESTAQLRPGDVLVFYTDGIVECENPLGEEYGEKRFRSSIRNAADLEPALLRDSVVAAASSFYGDRPRKDDITLVVARIMG